ncbi:MAG: hypothetical protein GWN31_16895 [Candidatus Thorarchaeota archaeon]|nr:hypothetical protein [Candidatus Thorarchaeota archaeon]
MLTGSHTPPEIIGALLFNRDTSELVLKEEEKFEQMLFEGTHDKVNYQQLGEIEYRDLTWDYIEYILSKIDLEKVAGRSVVVDPGNGSAAGVLKHGLEQAGVNTVAFNDYPDPTFPNRPPSPHPGNLGKLGRLAKNTNAIGIATDGDGDRAIFADEKGNVLWGDKSGAILAADAVKRYKTKKVVVTLNSSSVVKWAVKSAGGIPIESGIGPPAIISKMKDSGAPFGIEESGKNIWRDVFLYGDALLSTLRMLEILERTGSSLSKLASQLPTYYMEKIAIDCPMDLKEKVLERSFRKWQETRDETEYVEIISIDGKKIVYEDSWLLLRSSGTEPVFRVFAEAKSKERVTTLIDEGRTLVKEVLNELT